MMDEIHNTKEAEDFKNMSTKERVDYANKKEQESFRGFIDIIIKNLEKLPVNKVDIKIKK